jgi:ankyrin repeat protein
MADFEMKAGDTPSEVSAASPRISILPRYKNALFESIRTNDLSQLRNLLQSDTEGEATSLRDQCNRSGLTMAVWSQNSEAVNILINEYGFPVNVIAMDDYSLLHYAIIYNKEGEDREQFILRLLLEADRKTSANIDTEEESILNARTRSGKRTALHLAISHKKWDAVHALLDYNADIYAKDDKDESCLDMLKAELSVFDNSLEEGVRQVVMEAVQRSETNPASSASASEVPPSPRKSCLIYEEMMKEVLATTSLGSDSPSFVTADAFA